MNDYLRLGLLVFLVTLPFGRDPWVFGVSYFFVVLGYMIWKAAGSGRTIEVAQTYMPNKSKDYQYNGDPRVRPPKPDPAPIRKVEVALDRPKLDAVEALQALGMNKKAAIAALAASDWAGYPEASEMVIAALHATPASARRR